MNRKHKLKTDDEGAAAVEFALITPFILIFLLGVIDFGGMVYEATQLSSSARAGAQYALIKGEDVAGVEKTVSGATSFNCAGDVETSVSFSCECSDGSQVTCGEGCDDGSDEQKFVNVILDHNHPFVFSWLGLPDPFPMRGTATLRIE